MFHLIVMGDPQAYDETAITLERGRVLREYTSDSLSESYSPLTEQAIAALRRLPALFAYERSNKKDARIGWLTKIQARRDEARFTYQFDDTFPPISWEQIDALEWDLDIGSYELNRTHWALKDVDLFAILLEHGLLSDEMLLGAGSNNPMQQYLLSAHASIEARPTVFRIPQNPPDKYLVAVMMPFDTQFDPVYAAIAQTCIDLGRHCQRADDIFEASEVIQDVFSLIYRSAVVVCDFTRQNPNVYYETGIAHTLGKPVVPITQSDEHVTFDVRHHRFISYLNNDQGLKDLQKKLRGRLGTLFRLMHT